ncbi:hypothetical protein N7519_000856 [Penicillium mononematosum]|uniref:uncharacterized protein n=1 Tax=Penicillium mononematosum TaxID=268346 RepID=UPI002548E76D|nr:uncharacterized protein N7519_000856 [Penicillium mononematosum]KAJ6190835.1 hypothetical protein N7519_000856 [Penicillium mononematosum]
MSASSKSLEVSNPLNPPKPNVPKTASEWERVARKLRSQNPILHTLSKVNPASKLTPLDFAAMRALWPEIEALKAEEAYHDFPELQAYLRQAQNHGTDAVDRDIGAFLLVRESQKQIPSESAEWLERLESDSVEMQTSRPETRKKRNTSPPDQYSTASGSGAEMVDTKDEQLVNDALLLFLGAVLVYQPELKCQWTAHGSPFSTAVFGSNKMIAHTDGYLEANGEVFAIVEELLWQETDEMIAWIMHDEKHGRKCEPRRRLIVSQDNHEIFLTVATYDRRYLAYLKGGSCF